MKSTLLVVSFLFLLKGTAIADQEHGRFIGFTICRTTDVKKVLSTRSLSSLSQSDFEDVAIARGHASTGTATVIMTREFNLTIEVHRSPEKDSEYIFVFDWDDNKDRTSNFSVVVAASLGAGVSLPEDWEKKDLTAVLSAAKVVK